MMEIDGEPMSEVVMLQSILAHSKIEVRRVELDELERIQFATEHGVAFMSLYFAERQAELQTNIITKDMEPKEIAIYKEAMLQFVIKASLKDHEDYIVETNPSVDCVYPKPVFTDDDKLVEFAWSQEIDANKLRCLEEVFGAKESVSMEDMVTSTEQRKIMVVLRSLSN